MMIWLAIFGMAVVTLATRVLPLLLMRGEPPAWLARWLGLVPVAVFTALALQPLIIRGAPLLAGLVGAVAAWRTGSVVATIAVGMAAYWLLRALGAA
jgi:branched-subunit amino acid transport protein